MISYAQNGEDVVLARLLRHDGGTYVDLGAGHPVVDSVTKGFYERGWRGVNVEPLAEEHALLCADRPGDVNVRAAIADRCGEITLWVGPAENRGSSTTHEVFAQGYGREGQPFEPEVVPTVRLTDLLAEHGVGAIDFLKIDVEGDEAVVIHDTDWRQVRPRVLVVEATRPNSTEPAHEAWEPALVEAGYRCALFDGLNRFYALHHDDEALAVLAAPANVLDGAEPHRWRALVDAAHAELVAAEHARGLAEARAAQLEGRLAALGQALGAAGERARALAHRADPAAGG